MRTDRLAALVGADAVWTGGDAARRTVHGAEPAAVVAPRDAEEAAAVLALANDEGWAVEVAGAGSRLDWGRPPERVDLLVTTERLAGVAAYEPADLVASVGAGTTLGALAERLAPHGQWLPLDPPGARHATLGAVVALAAAGPLREGYGTPRDHVLGLQVVTGDGRVLELGGRVVKNVAGYDLVKPMIGSRGTLGLITRVDVRLRPVPARDETLALSAGEPAPLVELVARLREERIELAALELVSGAAGTPAAVRRADGWSLLVRLHGGAEAVAAAAERVRRAAMEIGAGQVRGGAAVERLRPLAAEADRAGARGAAGVLAEAATGPDPWSDLDAFEAGAAVCIRLADLPARLGETLATAVEAAASLEAPVVAAHAGAGIVRVLARATGGDAPGTKAGVHASRGTAGASSAGAVAPGPPAGPMAAAARRLRAAREALESRGGTLIIARAPRALLEHVDPFGTTLPPVLARLMKGLKATFDPAGVLAPDRSVV